MEGFECQAEKLSLTPKAMGNHVMFKQGKQRAEKIRAVFQEGFSLELGGGWRRVTRVLLWVPLVRVDGWPGPQSGPRTGPSCRRDSRPTPQLWQAVTWSCCAKCTATPSPTFSG